MHWMVSKQRTDINSGGLWGGSSPVFIRRDDGTPKSSEVKIRCSHSNSGSFIIRGSFIRGSFSQIHSNQGVHSKSDSVKGLCLLQDTAEIQPAVHTHDSSSCFTDRVGLQSISHSVTHNSKCMDHNQIQAVTQHSISHWAKHAL